MNPFRWSFRAQFLAGFLGCAALIGYAIYTQLYQGLEPCPLCIFQRLAYAALALVFLAGGLHAPRGTGGRKFYGVLVTLAYPGFVLTPLLQKLMDEGMARPFGIVDADTAARKILKAAGSGWRTVSFPWGLTAAVSLGRILPPMLYDWVMTRMAKQVKLPY